MQNISLAAAFQDAFRIGAAVRVEDLTGVHGNLLKQHFNSITAENVMKFGEIHPEEERYDFAKADKIADFARQNKMQLRGHTFVWHNQTSKWVFLDKQGAPASKELVIERLTQHVATLCDRYGDVVSAWDVVNEAIEDKSDTQYRDTPWRRILGEDYIQTVFQIVKAKSPNTALVYNDYNNEQPEKLDKTVQMLEILLKNGTPVDTVGIQAHWSIRDVGLVDNFKRAIERYAALGLKIQITEMDVSMFAFTDERKDILTPTAEMLQMQATLYRELFDVMRSYRDVVNSVTFWGISDMYTWKDNFPVRGRKDWPMLFDVNGAPKSAFDAIMR